MIKQINLIDKVNNNDGTISLIAECSLYYEDMTFSQHLSRSPFTFPDTMTDQEIVDSLMTNEYKIYF